MRIPTKKLLTRFKVPEYTNSGYFGTKKHTDWSV